MLVTNVFYLVFARFWNKSLFLIEIAGLLWCDIGWEPFDLVGEDKNVSVPLNKLGSNRKYFAQNLEQPDCLNISTLQKVVAKFCWS